MARWPAARTRRPRSRRVLILDGQQRITSLYGITRGRPPAFFQGDEKAFSGLRFHVEDEAFEFYARAKMRHDPRWIDLTSLYTLGLEPHLAALNAHRRTRPRIVRYVERLARLRQVLERDFHEEKITGADKSIDVVVDIFNLVNSGGTKLSKGDLVLARKCAHWPEARAAMRATWTGGKKRDFRSPWTGCCETPAPSRPAGRNSVHLTRSVLPISSRRLKYPPGTSASSWMSWPGILGWTITGC